MLLHFIDNYSEGDKEAQYYSLLNYFTLTDSTKAEVIYCGSIEKMDKAIPFLGKKPVITFCWDYYKWAHEGKHYNWDWYKYAEFLKKCDLVFVPSKAQQLRLRELLEIDSVIVHSGFPTYDIPVSDKGFILDPLRHYPEEQSYWAEKAAQELDIPFVHSEHNYSLNEFRELVASCSFMTSCVSEASTGGLTLMEGLYLGKKSLISDSKYMGASDYLDGFSVSFKDGDYEDMKQKMKRMWENKQKLYLPVIRSYISNNFSYDLMSKKIYENSCSLIS